jgi:prepilin-type N-terminal cleavage/methylation domain-containing protein
MKNVPSIRSSPATRGFSLVEVTVAIGIFAFVAVGILGLLPAALKIRTDSAQETRAVMIAQEMFSSLKTSRGITNIQVRVGTKNTVGDSRFNQDLTSTAVVVGYPAGTTVPFWFFENPDDAWNNDSGANNEVAQAFDLNLIQTLARLSAVPVDSVDGLYQVSCEVRSPASLPLVNSKPTVFTTYFYAP